MATEAQINANRRNAKSSTGPRTDRGKAAVRQNALRHGFCSSLALMDEEPEKEFHDLQNILLEENQPVGANEEILVYLMTVNLHNFQRANLAVCDALQAAEMDEQSVPPLPLALRYQGGAERSFKQNLNQLRKLQKERRLEEIGFDSQEAAETPAEPPEAPPPTPAEAPKPAPLPANQPVPAPVTARPVVSHLFAAIKDIVNGSVTLSQAPPKAA